MKIINYSHSDLDGVVCSILVNEYSNQRNIPCRIIKTRYDNTMAIRRYSISSTVIVMTLLVKPLLPACELVSPVVPVQGSDTPSVRPKDKPTPSETVSPSTPTYPHHPIPPSIRDFTAHLSQRLVLPPR